MGFLYLGVVVYCSSFALSLDGQAAEPFAVDYLDHL